MGYALAPAAYSRMFGVPADVVDKHIRLAGAVQLKVLLCLLARPEQAADPAGLAVLLGLPAEDLADAMQYWIGAGLVMDTARPDLPASESQPEQKTSASVKPVRRPPPTTSKPTREEVVARGMQSQEIAWLLSQAQLKLGRTISAGEMATFVYLHDTQGLPVEVIAMILEYCLSLGKANVRYMEKMALGWAQEEIDTLEKAERKLVELERQRKAWGQVQRAFGLEHRLPSEREQTCAARWIDEWHFTPAMLRLAYDVCIDSTGKCSFPYINKVLDGWQQKGVRTPEQARQEQAAKADKAAAKKGRGTSYDLDEIQKRLRSDS